MANDTELTPSQKAARTRKRRAAGKKAALTRKRKAAGKKAAVTRKRRAAGRKAAEIKKANSSISGVAAATATKSKALVDFEHGIDKLESRVRRGEFTSIPQILGEFNDLLNRLMPLMTDQERAMIQDVQLLGHDTGAKVLARHGQPVPGNDPRKPN